MIPLERYPSRTSAAAPKAGLISFSIAWMKSDLRKVKNNVRSEAFESRLYLCWQHTCLPTQSFSAASGSTSTLLLACNQEFLAKKTQMGLNRGIGELYRHQTTMSSSTILTWKGTLRQVFICLRPPPLLWPHNSPLHNYSHREGEGDKRWTQEKVRGATVHKAGSKIPTWLTVSHVYKLW